MKLNLRTCEVASGMHKGNGKGVEHHPDLESQVVGRKAMETVGPDTPEELVIFSGKGHRGDFQRTSALNHTPVEDLGPST